MGSSHDEDAANADRNITRRRFLTASAGAVGGGLLLASGAGAHTPARALAAVSKPRRGGNFRLGVGGGGPDDLFDGQNFIALTDEARIVTLFEPLLIFNDDYQLVPWLAEEVTRDSASQWTIRLRKGIEFSNGKSLRAEDVVYSLQRIADPKNALAGYTELSAIDPNGMKIMDPYTVRLHLATPNSVLDQGLGQYYNNIVPVGYKKWPAPQAGTGCFALQSFTPGQQSVSVRNKNYWNAGQPYFDSVTIIDINDDSARTNALLGGDIDAMASVPASLVSSVNAHSGTVVWVSEAGGWITMAMAVDMPPFDNNDVRQAMRYIVDRPQMVESVISGYGSVANDLFARYDPDYNHALPQRHQDLDKAKALLKKAGMEKFSATLHTTPGEAGMVEMASLFAEQARGAGANITVQNDPNFYGSQYLKLAFSVDDWGTRNYLPQVEDSMLRKAPFNESHWPPKSGPAAKYTSLYQQAVSTTNDALQREIIHEMQSLEYNYGGYIIPFWVDQVDGYSTKVKGLTHSRGTLPLGYWGHGYRTIWFD